MARGNSKMKEVDAMIREAEARLEQIQVELATLRAVRQRLSGEPVAIEKARAPRANVKQTVLDLLSEARHSGLNAAMAVQMAKDRGEHLDRGSVSSLLSRLKNDGVVTHDGKMYKLVEHPDPSVAAAPEAAVISRIH